MKRTALPEVLKGIETIPSNIKRLRTKPRKSLWDGFFDNLVDGDSFVIDDIEINTVKAHAEKHGFELRHKRSDEGKALAQVHKWVEPSSGAAPDASPDPA